MPSYLGTGLLRKSIRKCSDSYTFIKSKGETIMKASVKYSDKEGMEEYNKTNEAAWRDSVEDNVSEEMQDIVIKLWKDGLTLLIMEV